MGLISALCCARMDEHPLLADYDIQREALTTVPVRLSLMSQLGVPAAETSKTLTDLAPSGAASPLVRMSVSA